MTLTAIAALNVSNIFALIVVSIAMFYFQYRYYLGTFLLLFILTLVSTL